MHKGLYALAAIVPLAGCVTAPADYVTFGRADPGGAPQALAKCQAKSDAIPATQNAAANPLFAAAMQEQYVQDCMKAAGYVQR